MTRRTYPVVEMFGPTVQGEGPAQGERCWFVRLGGCDYRCTWCDSMYAVDPAQVRRALRLDAQEIAVGLAAMGFGPGDLLILSGGNPALHHCDELLDALPQARVHVETQGTVFRPWLNRCEMVVCSPKPPSAWDSRRAYRALPVAREFVAQLTVAWALKLVAFDEPDLVWATDCHWQLVADEGRPAVRKPQGCFLSAGTEQVTDPDELVAGVVSRFAWLAERFCARADLSVFRIGLQAHVLAWPGQLAK